MSPEQAPHQPISDEAITRAAEDVRLRAQMGDALRSFDDPTQAPTPITNEQAGEYLGYLQGRPTTDDHEQPGDLRGRVKADRSQQYIPAVADDMKERPNVRYTEVGAGDYVPGYNDKRSEVEAVDLESMPPHDIVAARAAAMRATDAEGNVKPDLTVLNNTIFDSKDGRFKVNLLRDSLVATKAHLDGMNESRKYLGLLLTEATGDKEAVKTIRGYIADTYKKEIADLAKRDGIKPEAARKAYIDRLVRLAQHEQGIDQRRQQAAEASARAAVQAATETQPAPTTPDTTTTPDNPNPGPAQGPEPTPPVLPQGPAAAGNRPAPVGQFPSATFIRDPENPRADDRNWRTRARHFVGRWFNGGERTDSEIRWDQDRRRGIVEGSTSGLNPALVSEFLASPNTTPHRVPRPRTGEHDAAQPAVIGAARQMEALQNSGAIQEVDPQAKARLDAYIADMRRRQAEAAARQQAEADAQAQAQAGSDQEQS